MLTALAKGVKGGVWFSLIDKVYRPSTLERAWSKVRAKRRKGGKASIAKFEAEATRELEYLHEQLRTDSYRPDPIRRVWIDKPGTREKRPLGISVVRDRVAQTALKLAIEPIFEWEFAPRSYGFRPGRGCQDALCQVDRLLKAGYTWVVDADLKGYFDSIPHDRLMDEVRQRIADSRVLELIEGYLKQDVLEELKLWTPEEGTPQGAVISPLLANIYLHPVDVAVAEAGYEMVRYADDFVILCRTPAEAEQALALVSNLTSERGLTLHPEKTQVVDATRRGQGFDFLGFHFEAGMKWPRKKSVKKLRDTIRRKTKRSRSGSFETIIEDVNRTLKGWFVYFQDSHYTTFGYVDGWVRRRLRSILRKRHKLRGISKMGLDHQRWTNDYFRTRGFYSLEEAYASLCQTRQGNH